MLSKLRKDIFNLLWLIFLGGVLLAFIFVNNIHSVSDFITVTKLKSKEIHACYNESYRTGTIQCSFRFRVGSYNTPEQQQQLRKEFNLSDITKSPEKTKPDKSNEEQTQKEEKKEDKKGIFGDIFGKKEDTGLKQIKATQKTKMELIEGLDQLAVVDNYSNAPYNRREYFHWTTAGHNCWNSREQALYQQSIKDTVKLLDKDKKSTKSLNNACYIEKGEWIDPYSGDTIKVVGEVDVDHIVPLKLVNNSGGKDWSREKKIQYANDPEVLVVTSAKENRSKSAKGPSQYMPKNKDTRCDYAKIYANALIKYNLEVSRKDKEVLEKQLKECFI